MKIPKLSVENKTFSEAIWNRFCKRYGKSRANRLVKALESPVSEFAIRANTTKISREKVINAFEEEGWKAKEHKYLDEMFTVRTRGRFPVPYSNSYPRIIIDKVAAESVFVGSNLFGVGIKRMPKFNVGNLVSIVSPFDQIVAVGKAKINSKTPKRKGIAAFNVKSFYEVPSIRGLGFYREGTAASQSIPSAYVAHVLDPKQNDKVIDLCAAPGGKSTSTAIISNCSAEIIAFDRSKKRMEKMRTAVSYQGLKNITLVRANSIDYFKKHSIRADKVIVDPSCSAIGVRPKIYESTKEGDISSVSSYQKSFLWVASQIIRKGGTITYSTCTLAPEENEKVVLYAVNELGLKLSEPNLLLGSPGEDFGDGLDLECMRRFYPDSMDTPGFFVAKLTK